MPPSSLRANGNRSLILFGSLATFFLLLTLYRSATAPSRPVRGARTPDYEGPPLVSCPILSPEEGALDASLEEREWLPKVWATNIFQSDRLVRADEAQLSWPSLNPLWRYDMLLDDAAAQYVEQNLPASVIEVYKKLPYPAAKADLLRYALLWAEGGVWADSDVICLRPISDWTLSLDDNTHIVVGIEMDHPLNLDKDWKKFGWASRDRGYDFVQWTLRARRHSLALRRTLVKLTMRALAQADTKWTDSDVLRITGPVVFTDAILETAACEIGAPVGWLNFSGMEQGSRQLGGALILPPAAFNGEDGYDLPKEMLVKHLFRSSWKNKDWWS